MSGVRRRLAISARLAVVIIVLACILVSSPPSQAQPSAALVARIAAPDAATTQHIAAAGFDIITRDGSDLLVLVSVDQYAMLQARGWDVQIDAAQTALLAQQHAPAPAFGGGYRTVAEVEQWVQQVSTSYPDLVTLLDIGDSWQRQQDGGAPGYDLWALRLTNAAITRPKPVFFLHGGIHAREISTVEIARRFADYLLQHYGSDPLVTWLLDEYEIVVVPLLNPDGYKLVEQGYLQRKNINDSNGGSCNFPPTPINQAGVDLNRNFALEWGTISAPTLSPCAQMFPGSGPVSEPETAALQGLVREVFGTARPRPAAGAAVPADTSGVLISLHSYSDLVLWPWGYTYTRAPDSARLAQLGQRLAAFNGYAPLQASGLYPAAGTTDDWAYGELGIAAYTFEIGPSYGECGGFMPPFACMESGNSGSFWARNLPALLYAAQVSRAPYTQPSGPDIAFDAIRLTTDTITSTLTLTLTTAAPLSTTEMYVGRSPWNGGSAYPLQQQDADSAPMVTEAGIQSVWQAALPTTAVATVCADEMMTCQASISAVPAPLLLVRGQTAAEIWGPLQAAWLPDATPLPVEEERDVIWLPLLTP